MNLEEVISIIENKINECGDDLISKANKSAFEFVLKILKFYQEFNLDIMNSEDIKKRLEKYVKAN